MYRPAHMLTEICHYIGRNYLRWQKTVWIILIFTMCACVLVMVYFVENGVLVGKNMKEPIHFINKHCMMPPSTRFPHPSKTIGGIKLVLEPTSIANRERSHLSSINRQLCECGMWNSTEKGITILCNSKGIYSETFLLTLFTTAQYSLKLWTYHMNVLRLWAALRPRLRPVLFVSTTRDNAELTERACDLGWVVLVAPTCQHPGLPIIPDMFRVVHTLFPNSTFYGYANADVLFDESLLDTLETLRVSYSGTLFSKRLLAVGERTEIKLQWNTTITDSVELRHLATTRGGMGFPAAEDYFISSSDGFPWQSIPKIAVGRVAYDNWLVWYANKHSMATVDLTETVLAAHQWGVEDHASSRKRKNAGLNNRLLGKFDFTKGMTTCSEFKTRFVQSPSSWVKQRGLARGVNISTLTDDFVRGTFSLYVPFRESMKANDIILKRRTKKGFCGAGHFSARRKNMGKMKRSEILADVPKSYI